MLDTKYRDRVCSRCISYWKSDHDSEKYVCDSKLDVFMNEEENQAKKCLSFGWKQEGEL